MPGKNDLANYRKMSEPFENSEDANKALKQFYDGVEILRNELHLTDVHVLAEIRIMNNNEEGVAISSAHFGDSLKGAAMCAWGLGQEQANFEDMLHKFVAGK